MVDREEVEEEEGRARNRSQSTRIIIANKVDVKGREEGGSLVGQVALEASMGAHSGYLSFVAKNRLASGPTRVKLLLSLFFSTVVQAAFVCLRNRARQKK